MTVDGELPNSWEAKVEEGGILRLGPAAWIAPGFWEEYFDRAPGAVEAYERELRREG